MTQLTPETFAIAELQGLGIAPSAPDVEVVEAWENAEGGHWHNHAWFNPQNTTLKLPGAGDEWGPGALAIALDGRRLAVSDSEGSVTVWDPRTPSRPILASRLEQVRSLAFSRSGALAVTSLKGAVCIKRSTSSADRSGSNAVSQRCGRSITKWTVSSGFMQQCLKRPEPSHLWGGRCRPGNSRFPAGYPVV